MTLGFHCYGFEVLWVDLGDEGRTSRAEGTACWVIVEHQRVAGLSGRLRRRAEPCRLFRRAV